MKITVPEGAEIRLYGCTIEGDGSDQLTIEGEGLRHIEGCAFLAPEQTTAALGAEMWAEFNIGPALRNGDR